MYDRMTGYFFPENNDEQSRGSVVVLWSSVHYYVFEGKMDVWG